MLEGLCLSLSLVSSIPASAPAHPLAGVWEGKASTGSDATDVYLRFDEAAGGAASAFLDLPLTNIHDVPFGKFELDGDEYAAGATRLRIDATTGTLHGQFRYLERDIRLELKRGDKVPAHPAPHAGDNIARPTWTFDAGSPIWSSPAVREDVVYFGASDGRVHALDARTGAPVWELRTKGAIFARPTLSGAHVYVPSDDGSLYKLDAKTGREVWRVSIQTGEFKRELPSNGQGGYDSLASAATVELGTVFIGSADGRMLALDAETGAQRFEFKTGASVRSTPAIADGTLVFGSRDHSVYALDAASGALKWKHDTQDAVVSSPVVDSGHVYIGSRSADMLALELATGRVSWRYFYWFSWVESSGTVRDGVLYVGSSDSQRLHAIDTKNGTAVWQFDTDGSAWSSPAVTDAAVYIGSVGTVGYMADHRGGFFAVDRKSGRERWRLSMSPIEGQFTYGVASSPAVANGLVYFGGLDGRMYACDAK